MPSFSAMPKIGDVPMSTTAASVHELKPLITPREAEAIGVADERTVRRWCANGKIRATKVGRDWRIGRDALLKQFGLADDGDE